MGMKTIVAQGPIAWVRLFQLSRLYPKCKIESTRVWPGAELSDNVRIGHDVELRSCVAVGRWSYIEPYTFVNSARIGSFCAIGRNVAIGGFEHPYRYPSISPRLYRELLHVEYDDVPPVTIIGNDVWVGEKAIILRGPIGDGAVIAAGAVVTSPVDPYSIVAGVPARKIGMRFSETEIERLLNLRWWDWPDERVIAERKLFDAREDWSLRV